jgi:hypothetical protein
VVLLPEVKTGGEATAKLKVCEAVPAWVDADTVNGNEPDAVGMPLSTPVMPSKVIPAGRAPTVIS